MKYILKIPKPCGEDWNKMNPTAKGMFCDSCKKEILDFTNFSNYQLSKKLDNKENICGRFKSSQINKELNSLKNIDISRFGILLGITSFISITQPIQSQNKNPKIEVKENNKKKSFDSIPKQQVLDTIIIKGNIIDHNKYPLPGVSILLKDRYIGTETDFHGNFSLKIPIEYLENKAVLVLTYLGFEPKEICINKETKILNVELTESDELLMGEVIIIKKQNIFRRIGNIFRRKG